MSDTYQVHVIYRKSGRAIYVLGHTDGVPGTYYEDAERIEKGLNIHLNHEDYRLEIKKVEVSNADKIPDLMSALEDSLKRAKEKRDNG
jgi:hypothetical protein